MRMNWWTAALLLMAGEIQVANADISDAMMAIASLGQELVQTYNAARQHGDIRLAESKKAALASIDAALIHMSVLKKHLAANIRCLGEKQARPDATAQSEFSLCFDNLKTENNDLERHVGNLKSSIDLADPLWISRHAEDAEQIDNLYFNKLGIYGRVLQFIEHSRQGIIFQKVLVDPKECKELADSLDAEADQLRKLEVSIGEVLRN